MTLRVVQTDSDEICDLALSERVEEFLRDQEDIRRRLSVAGREIEHETNLR